MRDDLTTGIGAPPGYGLTDPESLQPHAPIRIDDNANFTAANGVRNGSGAATDPYIIRDWSFDGSLYPNAHAMIWIERTDRYLVIENVRITNLTNASQYVGVEVGEYPAIVPTSHVTIRHIVVVDSLYAYGIAVREGSSDVRVEANDIRLNAQAEWVYGAVAMRGTHNVTFYGNHVNAYTNGSYHTVGIHLSDYFVSEARDATGLVAEQNTVVNATAGGIISESSRGTVVRQNLVYMDYPGPKSVAWNYPRGIETEELSNGTVVAGNVIHTFHWGIQVGSDRGQFYSNTIYDVDYAVYVLANKTWPDVSSYGDTIYNTTYWNVHNSTFWLPSNFTGTLVDLGPGITPTDFTAVRLITDGAASQLAYTWTGSLLNLSVAIGAEIVFDTAATAGNRSFTGAWSGRVEKLNLTSFLPSNLSFQLQAEVDVLFEGAGFPASTPYDIALSNGAGTTRVLDATTSSTGILRFTIPPTVPSRYVVRPDTTAPVTTYLAEGTAGTNGWYMSAVMVTLTATDDLSGVQSVRFRIDGGAWQEYTGAIAVRDDGAHTLEYYATDRGGNTEALHMRSIRVDTTGPVLVSLSPSGIVASSPVTISWAGSDVTSGVAAYAVAIDGRPSVSTGNGTTLTIPLTDGDHIVAVTAVDFAGNQVEVQTRFRVDTNVFSLSGPYSGIPSIVLVDLAIVAVVVGLWRRRSRRSRSRPPS